MDVDAVPLGVNFVKALSEEVAKCDVLLAVIGPNWLNARDEDGNRRLDNPHDFVRIEIGVALQRNIPVIPILLDGAKVPKPSQLPKELEELSLRNGLDVRHASFHNDIDKLVRSLKGRSAEADARRRDEDERRRQEAEIKQRADEEERQRKAEAEKRRRDEEQRRRQEKLQVEARQRAEEEQARQRAEEERRRHKKLQGEPRQRAEAERRRHEAEKKRQLIAVDAASAPKSTVRRVLFAPGPVIGGFIAAAAAAVFLAFFLLPYLIWSQSQQLAPTISNPASVQPPALANTNAPNSVSPAAPRMQPTPVQTVPIRQAAPAAAAADAEAKRKAAEAEQQRLAAVKAEEERKAKAEAEAAGGSAALPRSVSTGSFERRSNMRALGIVVADGASANSVAECEQKCTSLAACTAFSFEKSIKKCYFYSGAVLVSDQQYDSGTRK